MSVLVDVTAFSNGGNAGVTSDTFGAGVHGFTLNVGSGPNGTSNMALVIAVIFTQGAGGTTTGVSCSWDGVAMTQLTTQVHVGDIFLFGLRNPNTGSKNVTLSWTGANQCMLGALSAVNVDQTSDAAAFNNATTNTGSVSPASVSVTNASGNIAFGAHITAANFTTTGNTDIGHNNGGAAHDAAAEYDTAVNPTLSYSMSADNDSGSVGCSIVAAAAAGNNANVWLLTA